jgi:hypothetical protein
MNLLPARLTDACTSTRQIASATLESVLRELLAKSDPISEVALRDLWLHKLRRHQTVYPDG